MQPRLLILLLLLLTQPVLAQRRIEVTPDMIQTLPDGRETVVISVNEAIGRSDEIQTGPDGERFVEINESPGPPPSTVLRMFQVIQEANQEGKLLFLQLVEEEDAELTAELIGISEAQRLHIKAKGDEIRAMGEEVEESPADDSPEALAAFEAKVFGFFSQAIGEMDKTVHETLMPEQLQTLREYDLVNPIDAGPGEFVNFDAYEVLDLSEEQREKLKEIMEDETAQSKKELEELEKLASDPEKIMEKMQEKFENPEILKAQAAKIRARILEILTPEQRERLDNLKEEIPKKLAQLKEKRAAEPPKEDESWKEAWKPGDPIPEKFQQPTPAIRFPRKKADPGPQVPALVE